MIVTQITNHVQQGLNQLLEQYKYRPQYVSFLTAFLQHVQKLENALYPLDQYRQLLFAYGQQLDGLGEIIGQPRNGLPDNEYLVLLLGTIAENNSDTTAPAMLNVVQTLFQATNVFIKTPNSAGGGAEKPLWESFGVGSPQFPTALYPLIEQLIQNAVGACISVAYISNYNASGAFAMAGPQAWTKRFGPPSTPTIDNPWPFGFGDLNNPYVGGGFASLVFKDPTM
jgi:hypothetical protein